MNSKLALLIVINGLVDELFNYKEAQADCLIQSLKGLNETIKCEEFIKGLIA